MRRDLTAGLVLVAAGLGYALYSATVLPLGTLNQMGAGMFPMGLGLILSVLGVGVIIPSLIKDEAIPPVNMRALGAVLVALMLFALLIRAVGLLPTVVVTASVASLAIPGRRIGTVLALCAVLGVLTWFIFLYLLALPVPLIAWGL